MLTPNHPYSRASEESEPDTSSIYSQQDRCAFLVHADSMETTRTPSPQSTSRTTEVYSHSPEYGESAGVTYHEKGNGKLAEDFGSKKRRCLGEEDDNDGEIGGMESETTGLRLGTMKVREAEDEVVDRIQPAEEMVEDQMSIARERVRAIMSPVLTSPTPSSPRNVFRVATDRYLSPTPPSTILSDVLKEHSAVSLQRTASFARATSQLDDIATKAGRILTQLEKDGGLPVTKCLSFPDALKELEQVMARIEKGNFQFMDGPAERILVVESKWNVVTTTLTNLCFPLKALPIEQPNRSKLIKERMLRRAEGMMTAAELMLDAVELFLGVEPEVHGKKSGKGSHLITQLSRVTDAWREL